MAAATRRLLSPALLLRSPISLQASPELERRHSDNPQSRMEPYSEPTENLVPSATLDTQVALPPSSMSPEQPAAAEPPVRRRIVSAPQRKVAPIALILRERGSLPALEEKLHAARPVVVFPSLSHFCTESHRSERWAGIVVARACAWDARLDDYVADRSLIALYEDAEGYGWPEAVHRLRADNLEGIDGWLAELDTPRIPVARPKPKRVERSGTARTRRPRVVFSLWGDESKNVVNLGGSSAQSSNASSVKAGPVNGTAQSSARPESGNAASAQASEGASTSTQARARTREKAEKASRVHKPRAVQQTLPFDDQADEARRARAALRDRIIDDLKKARDKKAARAGTRGRAQEHAAFSRAEEAIARMAVEIGLLRASELLSELRQRAKSVAVR